MLEKGMIAPDFSLKDQDGKIHKLSEYKGKKIVLYFYPRDDTPGCTTEACSFRDNYFLLKEKGAVIIGVSRDDNKSHSKFRKKYNLPFTLLTDENHEILEKYGAWTKKNLYGKIMMGVSRMTYVIGENGKIIKVYKKVKPKYHAEEILKFI